MEQLLLNIARGLVENKDAVSVTGGDKNEEGAIVFHLSVAPEDMGRVIGKQGRIVVIDNEIRVMCSETDVFRCKVEDAQYYMLLSGDGITVSGVNTINDKKMDIIVYYKYHRK